MLLFTVDDGDCHVVRRSRAAYESVATVADSGGDSVPGVIASAKPQVGYTADANYGFVGPMERPALTNGNRSSSRKPGLTTAVAAYRKPQPAVVGAKGRPGFKLPKDAVQNHFFVDNDLKQYARGASGKGHGGPKSGPRGYHSGGGSSNNRTKGGVNGTVWDSGAGGLDGGPTLRSLSTLSGGVFQPL